MAKISSSELLAGLKKSGIVEPKRLAEFLENVTEDTPEAIAKKLVRESLATQWQAKYLMSGRSRLDIGSYRLLERIRRDEFGDRFLAVQTSLDRKVDIQVLPGTLTNDKSSCDRFIQKASLAAQLDHPNLMHVYDIDHEGGRYYLVTEHIGGKTLEETDAAQLSETIIAQIISQAIDGISYAHQHNVIHGCIGPADLMLDSHQQVKIQHLPLTPLRQQISGNEDQPTKEHDFSAIARIGSFLLHKANITDNALRSELADVFDKLSTATPEAVTATSVALGQYFATESAEFASDLGGFDQPIATTSDRHEKRQTVKEETEVLEEPEHTGYLKRLWKDNPIAVIGTSLVIALMLVGGSVYGGFSLMGKLAPTVGIQGENPESTNDQKTGSKDAGNSDATQPTKRLLNTSTEDDLAPAIPTEEEMNKFLADINNGNNNVQPGRKNKKNVKRNQPAGKLKSTPTASKNHTAVMTSTDGSPVEVADSHPAVDNPDANLKSETRTADSANVVMTNVVTKPATTLPTAENAATTVKEKDSTEPIHTDLTVIRGIAEKTQAVLRKGQVKSLEQMANMSPEEIQSAIRAGGWSTANRMEEYKSWIALAKLKIGDESPMKTSPVGTNDNSTASGPFANFPRVAQLPPMENTAEIKIADLVIKNQYLLGAELICEQGAVKGRTTFELERSEDDNQKWIVGVKKSPNQEGIPIAAFRKSEDAFHFRWLPEANSDKNLNKLAPYLRNCFVKLILPEDESTLLTLREPIKIADLRLTAESLSNEVEFLIPAMPEPESIVVEVLPMRIPDVDTRIPNSRIERGNPARILLKKSDKTGFLWIQVSGELRSKMKLRSNLTLLVQGQTQPVLRMQALQDLALNLDAAAVRAHLMYDQFSKPPSMKKGEFDKKKAELLKDAKAQQVLKDKIMNYGEILPKILNQPISVRVYSKLGNYQTVLAVSDPTVEQEKK